MGFKKYDLTESQLKQIARLCVQEQGGSDAGTRAEASQAANLLETNSTYQKKYGSDIWSFMRNSGWYYKASYFFDNGSANSKQIEAVRDVLVNGNRFFPGYVDEHDAISDISQISTGSKTNRSDYIKGKTIIKNKMGSTYTFYSFPAYGCDPFGYTASAYEKVMGGGGSTPDAPTLNEDVKWTGYVTAGSLNVRTWAGTENEKCSFSPLSYQDSVGVCDTVNADDGSEWYYILYDGKRGFCSAKYIDKTKPADKLEDEKPSQTTGNPQQKVVEIATAEIGYLEKASNSKLNDKTANAGNNNYTKYARDVAPDVQGMAWCATYCMWVFTKAFGKDTARKMCNGLSPDCDEVAANYKEMGRFYKSPKIGDQILFVKNGNDYYHTGIVVDVKGSTVVTVEGNTSAGEQVIPNGGAVCKKSYDMSNSKIGGYGRPKYELVSSSQDTPTSSPTPIVDYITVGAQGDEVKKLQKMLNALGYSCGSEDGYFGERTSTALKQFKKANGMTVNNHYGTKTAEKLEAAYKAKQAEDEKKTSGGTVLKRGDKGEAVKKMQQMLAALGYGVAVDGDFGVATEKAVTQFQKSSGLKISALGTYGPKTEKALVEAYNNRPTAKSITVAQFLKACKNVMDMARTKGYHYGDSHATPPCSDKTISCDRLIARALYDLGFTDQRQGGETCGTFDTWLKNHGFVRSTKTSAIKKGSILMVKHDGKSYTSHMFVCTGFNSSNWVTNRYDAGSNERIKTAQPLKNVAWGYRKDSLIVYNIP